MTFFKVPKTALFLMLGFMCFMMQPVNSAHSAHIVAKVDLSQQRMVVYVRGEQKYTWPVSTGRQGWPTPTGKFRPWTMYRNYYEKAWNAHLPYLVAVHGGVAIHGTNATHKLGRPASHGCIRLSMGNASRFYGLVKRHGLRNTRVVIKH